ncbi:MAG: endonuclease/exonuclease/phosphatase family protein [Desulfobacterales bacterium]|jgi:endonuclease/exonuclease/phosphatase family metal-dependent hydrolase
MTGRQRPLFSVLTLNLRFGLADDGPNAWPHRREILRQLINAHASDFMTFQEANDFQIDFLADCLPDYDVIGQRDPAPPFWQNNIVCYRPPWKLECWEHFYLSPTPDIPSRFTLSRWPRQCTLGRFRNGRHDIVCGTTHLDFDEAVQVASAEIILRRTNRLAAQRPVVLTGDFNCPPTSACHDLFTHEQVDRNQHHKAFHNALAPTFPGTFHGFQGGGGRTCIDWILYRGAIRPRKARIIPFQAGARFPSDHYPVAAEFLREI